MTYDILQQYWWFLISLLGALLVFLMFVQGGQTLFWELGDTEGHKRMVLLATGRKWELTFTTLVVFGGAFFAAFPLFYSTSFGGAYWVWILILLCFVLQAVSYEFQLRRNNVLGTGTFRAFLFLNGILAPLLLGTAISTFFHGAEFVVHKTQITKASMPIISQWCNPMHGLEAALNPWNLCLGLALLFLSRLLALLYLLNNIGDAPLRLRCRRRLPCAIIFFLIFFLPYMMHWLTMDGFSVNPDTGLIHMEATKYLNNLLAMPPVATTMILGILLVLMGALSPLVRVRHHGIWLAGSGSVLTVLALLLCAGWNHTAYYPSLYDLQSSLHLSNSCSSFFTLKVMFWVSLLIPFVLGYIIWAWKSLENKPITAQEVEQEN